jgi:hypothetical protein
VITCIVIIMLKHYSSYSLPLTPSSSSPRSLGSVRPINGTVTTLGPIAQAISGAYIYGPATGTAYICCMRQTVIFTTILVILKN